jgi:hypothetical protein
MSAISKLFDTTTKRWLAVLAAAVLLSGAVMAHSLIGAFFPASEEPTVTVELPARVVTQPVVSRAEPVWNENSKPSTDASVDGQTVPPVRTSPFAAEENEKQQAQQALQTQAKYFQQVMVNGKLPASLGSLTKEQVDDLQKKGLIIE